MVMVRDAPCLSIEDTVISLRAELDGLWDHARLSDTVTSTMLTAVTDRRPGHLGDGGFRRPTGIPEEPNHGEAGDQWRD